VTPNDTIAESVTGTLYIDNELMSLHPETGDGCAT